MHAFHNRLRVAISNSPFSQVTIARKSGYSEGHVVNLKKGRRMPTIQCVESLAEVLEVNPAWLAGWSDDDAEHC